jgi:hypothetical protein
MNETTLNLIKALEEYKPIEAVPVVIKMTYDPETLIVTGTTVEDTDGPWIEITQEQYDAGIQFKRLKVINGKIEEITREDLKKKL